MPPDDYEEFVKKLKESYFGYPIYFSSYNSKVNIEPTLCDTFISSADAKEKLRLLQKEINDCLDHLTDENKTRLEVLSKQYTHLKNECLLI